MLQQEIFAGHPYGHSPAGTVEGLQKHHPGRREAFYKQHYTRANLMLGVAGGYPAGLRRPPARRTWPPCPRARRAAQELPPAPKVEGRNFTLIEKETGSVGINLGFPLPITRADADYYPLMVANSFLGEHRTFHGRLMNAAAGQTAA